MSDFLRILLIDDDKEDYLIVSDMLSEIRNPKYRLDWVQSYEAGIETICRGEHDLYLLDYFLGAKNGLELLREVLKRGCRVPIIFLTAYGNYETDLAAMKAGAADYLVKGELTVPLFERTIRYSIERKQTEEELRQHRQNLENLVEERTLQHAEARADAERRATDAERRQSILEALLEHIPEGIAIVDSPDLQIQALSRYALRHIGFPSEKYKSARLTDQNIPLSELGAEEAQLLPPIRDAAILGKVASNQEHVLKMTNGDGIAVLVSAGPIRDNYGNITGAIAAWRDISELKQVQEELSKARDELELRVHRRTLELAETLLELRESQEDMKLLAAQLLSAQEDERKRIAREMHDSIGSSLSAVKFSLETVTEQLQRENAVTPDTFLRLSKAMEQAIEESRRIMTDLRPSILDDLGIIATIGWFCRRYQSTYTTMTVEKSIRIEEDQIPDNLKIILFRIIQEAMNNAAKYSHAEKIYVSLTVEAGRCIQLGIEDNGIGFEPAAVTSRGECAKFGLTSMRERAELSGGRFEIESSPGKGTRIHACWLDSYLQAARS
ncbi:MAG: response regulator [Syntrophobacteraceae bacterium]